MFSFKLFCISSIFLFIFSYLFFISFKSLIFLFNSLLISFNLLSLSSFISFWILVKDSLCFNNWLLKFSFKDSIVFNNSSFNSNMSSLLLLCIFWTSFCDSILFVLDITFSLSFVSPGSTFVSFIIVISFFISGTGWFWLGEVILVTSFFSIIVSTPFSFEISFFSTVVVLTFDCPPIWRGKLDNNFSSVLPLIEPLTFPFILKLFISSSWCSFISSLPSKFLISISASSICWSPSSPGARSSSPMSCCITSTPSSKLPSMSWACPFISIIFSSSSPSTSIVLYSSKGITILSSSSFIVKIKVILSWSTILISLSASFKLLIIYWKTIFSSSILLKKGFIFLKSSKENSFWKNGLFSSSLSINLINNLFSSVFPITNKNWSSLIWISKAKTPWPSSSPFSFIFSSSYCSSPWFISSIFSFSSYSSLFWKLSSWSDIF